MVELLNEISKLSSQNKDFISKIEDLESQLRQSNETQEELEMVKNENEIKVLISLFSRLSIHPSIKCSF
jgi:chaperonin cofactor prefoldin